MEQSMKCYLNGKILPLQDAQLNINDLSILRGYGIFDYFLFERFQPRFLEDYLNRFYRSAAFLGLQCPIEKDELRKAIHQVIAANEVPTGSIRLELTGGYAEDGFTPTLGNLFILQGSFPVPPPEHFQIGSRVATYQHQRALPSVKSLNYLIGIYILPWLEEQNAHYPLYLDGQFVRESDRSNFFLINEAGTLITAKDKILQGITRAKVLDCARELGIPTEVREVKVEELYTAKEAFMTSSIKGALPVSFIDGKAVGNGRPGEQTLALQDAFLSLVKMEQVH